MRGKVARALRREARAYARQTGRAKDVTRTIEHEVMVGHERLTQKRQQVFYTDGPRFFYLRLKEGFRRGLLRVKGPKGAISPT